MGVGFEFVAESAQAFGEFVPIEVRGEAMRPIHGHRMQCLPSLFNRVVSRIHHHAVRVQVRIKLPAGVVPEAGRDQISRGSFAVLLGFAHTGFRPFFEFHQGDPNRPIVQFDDPFILKQCDHRDAFRRRNREVEKHPPVRHQLARLAPHIVNPLPQTPSRFGVLAFTQGDKSGLPDHALQAQLLGPLTKPFPGHLTTLRIIIARPQMLPEIPFGIRQIELNFCLDHRVKTPTRRR